MTSNVIPMFNQPAPAGDEVTITFPRSRVLAFYAERNALTLEERNKRESLRLGQHFYQFMQLEKVTSRANQVWSDRLYEADGTKAGRMIIDRTDWDC